jgi:hypothetical protein
MGTAPLLKIQKASEFFILGIDRKQKLPVHPAKQFKSKKRKLLQKSQQKYYLSNML